MKKLLALLLTLSIIFCVTACAKKEPVSNTPTQNDSGASVTPTPEKAPEKEEKDEQKQEEEKKDETPKTETVYDIKCRSSKDIKWKTINLNDAVTNATVTITVPSDWSLTKSEDDAYTLKRDGKEIGEIKSLSFAAPKEVLDKVTKTAGNLTNTKQISLHNTSGDTYYHSFSFKTSRKNPNFEIYLRVKYPELDSAAADKLYSSAKAVTDYINYNFPDISKTNGSKKIVAMGNSFTGHSRVAPILNDMLLAGNTGYTAESITIANSALTAFAERDDILKRIENGEFCYVVQSGFYNSIKNITAFEVVKAACDKSGTKLVAMPAHNEDDKIIAVGASKFYDAMFVNWKGQLDSLISSGVARSDLCTDDNVKHCKPLAGYVAAFMLYRNMFGKNPPAINSTAVSNSEIAKVSKFTSTYTPPKSAAAPTFSGTTYVID